MNKITITKSKAGHYWVTVRDSKGQIVLTEKFDGLEQARRAASPYRTPSDEQLLAALGPCGK
jgi:hypothetical protein